MWMSGEIYTPRTCSIAALRFSISLVKKKNCTKCDISIFHSFIEGQNASVCYITML